MRYAYRSLDRQYCLADSRLADFPRPTLWRTMSARQLFMTSLLADLLGSGPAATLANVIPDMHHFSGRGGKDIIPLWRDAACTEPNVTSGVLDALTSGLGEAIEPEDLFAYCYAILSAPDYVERFLEELEVPRPHVPITRDVELFRTAVQLGRRLVWLHTFGERLVPEGIRVGQIPQGAARCTRAVPTTPDGYPTAHRYDEESQELHVGEGIFTPVNPAVREYSVSGLDVVGSWLDYRMKEGAGRRSSPLDAIRPEVWPPEFTEELLRLLWVIEHTVALAPELNETLAVVVGDPCFLASELPDPTDAERAAPS